MRRPPTQGIGTTRSILRFTPDSGGEQKPVLHVVGARPNFSKMAPALAALGRAMPDTPQLAVHTGQQLRPGDVRGLL